MSARVSLKALGSDWHSWSKHLLWSVVCVWSLYQRQGGWLQKIQVLASRGMLLTPLFCTGKHVQTRWHAARHVPIQLRHALNNLARSNILTRLNVKNLVAFKSRINENRRLREPLHSYLPWSNGNCSSRTALMVEATSPNVTLPRLSNNGGGRWSHLQYQAAPSVCSLETCFTFTCAPLPRKHSICGQITQIKLLHGCPRMWQHQASGYMQQCNCHASAVLRCSGSDITQVRIVVTARLCTFTRPW